MRWIGCLLILVLVLQSCEEEVPDVSFMVKLSGFALEGDIYCPQNDHEGFEYSYSGGLISFTRDNEIHSFEVGDFEIGEYLFKLPPGEYILKADIPEASLYGQSSGSYVIAPEMVTITEQTDTLNIYVDANCSLILVRDETEQLAEGPYIIEKHSYAHGYYKAYPMAKDSITGLYFAYFTPDPVLTDPSAFLWFFGESPGGEEGGLPTVRFQPGYKYLISVIE